MTKKINPSDHENSERQAHSMPELLRILEATIRRAISEKERGQLEVKVFINGENGPRDIGTFRSNLPGNIEKDSDPKDNFNFGVAC